MQEQEKSKYYTPDIEDIRVGYEGEINWSRGYSETFVPFKITVQNEDFAYTGLLSEIVDAMDDGYAEVKTPYLTKKQIEAEGWKFDYGLMDHMFFSKECAALVWFGRSNSIEVQQPANLVVYNGHCSSINEFRYITKKLLNI